MCWPILKLHLIDIQSDTNNRYSHHLASDGTVDQDASQFLSINNDIVRPFHPSLNGKHRVKHIEQAQRDGLREQKLISGFHKRHVGSHAEGEVHPRCTLPAVRTHTLSCRLIESRHHLPHTLYFWHFQQIGVRRGGFFQFYESFFQHFVQNYRFFCNICSLKWFKNS